MRRSSIFLVIKSNNKIAILLFCILNMLNFSNSYCQDKSYFVWGNNLNDTDKLGSLNYAHLNFYTNNIKRGYFSKDGDVYLFTNAYLSKSLYLDSIIQATYLSILQDAHVKGVLRVGNTIYINGSIVPGQGELSRDEISASKDAITFGRMPDDINKFSDIRFGFGTQQPMVNFHIKGRSYIEQGDIIRIKSSESTGNPQISGTTLRIEDEKYGGVLPIGNSTGTWWDFTASDNNNKLYIGTKAYDEANKPYTNNLIAVTTGGNVGIGTIYPKQKLHVNNGNIYISSKIPSLLFSNNENNSFGNFGVEYLAANQINNNYAGLNFFIPAANPNNNKNFIFHISDNGNVGIGTGSPSARLDINYHTTGDYAYASIINLSGDYTNHCKAFTVLENGNETFVVWGSGVVNVNNTLYAKAVKVRSNPMINWPDNVFESNYKLMPLKELEQYISQNKHLPNIPTQDEISKDGMDVYEMNAALLKKVEELTLYVIELEKRMDEIEKDK